MDPILAGQRAVSVGTSAAKNLRTFVGRSAKITTPITVACGAIADLASTIGAFSAYLLIASICVALISGGMWFLRYRRDFMRAAADGTMQPEEVMQLGERNGWSITFAFAVVSSVVMGGFVLAERLAGAEDKGVLAATVPGMEQLQASLFRVEKKIDAVKEDTVAIKDDTTAVRADTTAVRQDTAKIAATVEEMARQFATLSSRGGVIAAASTPEEHYHNARLHELGGNYGAARKSYLEFLQANLEVLDPWLNYSAMLKVQEGRAGAIEALRYFGEKLPEKTSSYQITLALLEEPPARLAKLEELVHAKPDFGPVLYLLSQEFTEPKKSEVTLADQRSERSWLEKFRAARDSGKFVKYFLDQKEAQKWSDTADARWAKLTSTTSHVLDKPVSITPQQSNDGWAITFTLADYTAKELSYRLDGQGDFKSTGHLGNNPQTGRPMINSYVPLPNLPSGKHTVEVRYLDRNDQLNGPYTLKFSTADEQLSQGKQMLNSTIATWLQFRDYDGKLLLYFTSLMSCRPVIKEVRYSLNNETLDRVFAFKPTNKMFEVGDDIYISIPKTTQFACVEILYNDGTKSPLQKFPRPPQ